MNKLNDVEYKSMNICKLTGAWGVFPYITINPLYLNIKI